VGQEPARRDLAAHGMAVEAEGERAMALQATWLLRMDWHLSRASSPDPGLKNARGRYKPALTASSARDAPANRKYNYRKKAGYDTLQRFASKPN